MPKGTKSQYVFVADLAERIGIDRSCLHKRIKREGIEPTMIPRQTDSGVQRCSAIPREHADAVADLYATARSYQQPGVVEIDA